MPVGLSRDEASPKNSQPTLWLLLVGVKKFSHLPPEFPDLKFSATDCGTLGRVLSKSLWSFPCTEKRIYADGLDHIDNYGHIQQPTLANITDGLNYIYNNSQSEDTIILYFSTHGVIDKKQDVFLLTNDTQVNNLETTSLNWEYLLLDSSDLLLKNRANKILVIIDACRHHSDFKVEQKIINEVKNSLRKRYPLIRQAGKNFAVLISCDLGQISWESEELQHSVFTYYLIEYFNKSNIRITVRDLFNYVSLKTQKYISSQGEQQTPKLMTSDEQESDRDWIIANNLKAGAEQFIQKIEAISNLMQRLGNYFHSLRRSHSIIIPILTSLLTVTLIIILRSQGIFQTWELKAFDNLMQERPLEGQDQQILVVKTTEDNQQNPSYEPPQPISDQIVATLIEKLEQYQPRIIGLDIYRDIPQGEGYQQLSEQIERNKNLIVLCKVRPDGIDKVVTGEKLPPGISQEEQQNRVGFSNAVVDEDDVIRRHLLQWKPNEASLCQAKYAFSFQLALRYLQQEDIKPQSTKDNFLQLGKTVFKQWKVPAGGYQRIELKGDGGYQILLNYRPYNKPSDITPTVPFPNVLNEVINSEDVKDHIVLIGYADGDLHKTPYTTNWNDQLPGVFITAQMVSQIINAAKGERPLLQWLTWWGDALWIWVWSLLGSIILWGVCMLIRVRQWRWLLSIGLVGVLGTFFYSVLAQVCLLFLGEGYWIPLIPTELALLFSMIGIVVFSSQLQRRQF